VLYNTGRRVQDGMVGFGALRQAFFVGGGVVVAGKGTKEGYGQMWPERSRGPAVMLMPKVFMRL